MSLLSFAKKIAGQKPTVAVKKTATKTGDKQPEAKSKETAAVTPLAVGTAYLEPLITEKSMMRQGKVNAYAFRVEKTVTKGQVAAAVIARYGIVPTMVRTLMMHPKRRRRGVTVGKTAAWKKAYVTLPAGKTIDLTA